MSAGAANSFAQDAAIRGSIVDAANGEPLAIVSVALQDQAGLQIGTTTTIDGFFRITGIEPGRHIMLASLLGYAVYRDTLDFESGERKTVNLRLRRSTITMEEVTITAESVGRSVASAGLQTITPNEMELVPMPDISGDLAAYLQVLPGVISPGDRGGQLFVRGGTPSQNLVLLDGMPLYQPFHIIGLFSAFPSEIVRSADVYTGGYGAEYGGRLSSVIDVTTRNGNKERMQASASVATYLTSLHFEGPLKKGQTSFVGSIRETLAERASSSILVGDLPFRFGDAFLKVHSNLTDGTQLSFTFVNSHDRGQIDETESIKSDEQTDLLNVAVESTSDEIKWGNTAGGFRLVTMPEGTPIFGEVTGSITRYVNEFGNPENPERKSTVFVIRAATELAHQVNRTKVRWGLSIERVGVDYDLDGLFQDVDAAEDSYAEIGPYVDLQIRPTGSLKIEPGLHAFVIAGNRNAVRFEPRIRTSWYPAGYAAGHELSAAVGLYHQNLIGLRDERDAGDVFTAWTLAGKDQGLPSALHAIAGWRSEIGTTLELGVEGYYKTMSDLSVPAWSAFPRFTTTIRPADGEVYGLDARVSVDADPFRVLVGYGFQSVEYTAFQESFAIWFGTEQESYRPPHDRRHHINLLLSTKLPGVADLNLRWEYGSGLPYTRPFGFDDWIFFETLPEVTEESGEYRVNVERPYQGRLPTYHRLDASIKRKFAMSSAILTLQAGVFNAYDRPNLFYFDVWTLNRVDQMSLLPSFGIKLETR